ncbi:MAG: hypothetical protein JRH15_13525 [Deltaproteobacteria bacterium]|nr:hypothetical protein [Deltaproteobacteria bacterium]
MISSARKTLVVNAVPSKYGGAIKYIMGLLSGTAIAVFGAIFLLAAIHTAGY